MWTIQISNFTCFHKGVSPIWKKESVGFQAKCAYQWAVTVLIWLLKKICLQIPALELLFDSPEVPGLRTLCQIRTRYHWAFWKCPVPTECKDNWLILTHLRSLADRPCRAQQSQLLPGVPPWISAVTALTLGLQVYHWTAEGSPQIVAKIHLFHAGTFAVWIFTHSLPWSQGIKTNGGEQK